MTDHDHSRTFQADHPEPTTDAARIGLALRELLIEAGHYTADEEQAVIEAMQGASPENGAKIVARAWTDPAYKERLIENGGEALREAGFDITPYEFTVMENTKNIPQRDRLYFVLLLSTLAVGNVTCLVQVRELSIARGARTTESPGRIRRQPERRRRRQGARLDRRVALHGVTTTPCPAPTTGSEEKLAALVTRDSLIGTQRVLQI